MMICPRLTKHHLVLILTIILSFSLRAQICETGALYVTGSGCGCLSGCDLTPDGGPNCNPGVGGNCDAGYVYMSTTFEVPSGCEVRITAEMKNRPSCSASGADGNCTSCDRLRIRNTASGTPPWQIGGGNASLFDQLTVTGPATIIIEGAANRSDEIISYTIENVGSCTCSQVLPVELLEFTGEAQADNINLLQWTTATEINNDYFTLERSEDAINFEAIATIGGAGNSSVINHYHFFDAIGKNAPATYYYRLKQTDFDGKFEYFNIVAISRQVSDELSAFYSQKQLHLLTNKVVDVQLFDMAGKEVFAKKNQLNSSIDLSFLSTGLYVYRITSQGTVLTEKFLVE